MSAAGERVGQALLFYGCRHPEHDWLYGEEFAEWERAGVVTVHAAYSAVPGHPYRFVQDALLAQGDAVWAALGGGGHFYVCGDGARMAPAVRATLLEIFRRNSGGSGADAEEWLADLERTGRYQQDVFA